MKTIFQILLLSTFISCGSMKYHFNRAKPINASCLTEGMSPTAAQDCIKRPLNEKHVDCSRRITIDEDEVYIQLYDYALGEDEILDQIYLYYVDNKLFYWEQSLEDWGWALEKAHEAYEAY